MLIVNELDKSSEIDENEGDINFIHIFEIYLKRFEPKNLIFLYGCRCCVMKEIGRFQITIELNLDKHYIQIQIIYFEIETSFS